MIEWVDVLVGKELGIRAENFVMGKLSQSGIPYTYADDWYDILVNGEHKLEVKSCQISVRDGKEKPFRVGRFDFTDEDNRDRMYSENIWVVFVVMHCGIREVVGNGGGCNVELLPEMRANLMRWFV